MTVLAATTIRGTELTAEAIERVGRVVDQKTRAHGMRPSGQDEGGTSTKTGTVVEIETAMKIGADTMTMITIAGTSIVTFAEVGADLSPAQAQQQAQQRAQL